MGKEEHWPSGFFQVLYHFTNYYASRLGLQTAREANRWVLPLETLEATRPTKCHGKITTQQN